MVGIMHRCCSVTENSCSSGVPRVVGSITQITDQQKQVQVLYVTVGSRLSRMQKNFKVAGDPHRIPVGEITALPVQTTDLVGRRGGSPLIATTR